VIFFFSSFFGWGFLFGRVFFFLEEGGLWMVERGLQCPGGSVLGFFFLWWRRGEWRLFVLGLWFWVGVACFFFSEALRELHRTFTCGGLLPAGDTCCSLLFIRGLLRILLLLSRLFSWFFCWRNSLAEQRSSRFLFYYNTQNF